MATVVMATLITAVSDGVVTSLRVQPVALSNSFFGSACREWQDHLSLGLHVSSGARRGDKKTRHSDTVRWKDKFFESTWGQRSGNSEVCVF